MKLLQIYETTVVSDDSSHAAQILTVPMRSWPNGPNTTVNDVMRDLGLEEIVKVSPSDLGRTLAALLSPSRSDDELADELRGLTKRASPGVEAPVLGERDLSFAEAVAFTDVVPFESSPLAPAALAKFVTAASGGALGAYAGFVAFGGGPLLLVMVPAGMILCGAAKGLADGLEQGLRERILKMLKPKRERERAKSRSQEYTSTSAKDG